MEIIENHPSTKGFKYRLLSELIRLVEEWDGREFNRVIFFTEDEIPKVKKLKIDRKLFENERQRKFFEEAIKKYSEDYLNEGYANSFFTKHIVIKEVCYSYSKPPLSIEIILQNHNRSTRFSLRPELWRKAADLLDELVEEPYNEVLEREIVLKKLGEKYECGVRWDVETLTPNCLNNEERKHIQIFKILREFEKEGLIRARVNFSFITKIPTLADSWVVEFIAQEKFLKIWEKERKKVGEWKLCGKFGFNLNDGSAIYGKVETNFRPESKEYKILKLLLNSPNKRVSADEIVKTIYGKGEASSVDKRQLAFLIRNIKRKLRIIGKNKLKENRNIFKACNGYKIICE